MEGMSNKECEKEGKEKGGQIGIGSQESNGRAVQELSSGSNK